MFELRDHLMVKHLINVSEIVLLETDISSNEPNFEMTTSGRKELIKSICDFSYDVLAVKQIFQESLCSEILVLTLIMSV